MEVYLFNWQRDGRMFHELSISYSNREQTKLNTHCAARSTSQSISCRNVSIERKNIGRGRDGANCERAMGKMETFLFVCFCLI